LGPALLPPNLQGRFPRQNSEQPRAREKVVWKGPILKEEKRPDLPVMRWRDEFAPFPPMEHR
jgi:hypothetical protein